MSWRSSSVLAALVTLLIIAGVVHAKTAMTVGRRDSILSTGHVSVLNGSAGALALTYYLTGPADLHYAVVPSGAAALDAAEIKAASGLANASQAGTLVAPSAQRLAWTVTGLAPNATYDVYFVAEVSRSNGVYGTVVSVNGTTTHPHAPRVTVHDSWPQHATTTCAALDVAFAAPGLLHYVVTPVASTQNLSAADVWSNATGRTRTVPIPTSNRTFVNISHLAPSTAYHVSYVAEVFGSGGVLGPVGFLDRAFTTHATPPAVLEAWGRPRDASTTDVVLGVRLDVGHHDDLASQSPRVFQLHYVAEVASDENAPTWASGAALGNATNSSTRQAGHFRLSVPVQASDSATLIHATETELDFLVNVSNLAVGTSYRVAVAVQTAASYGVWSPVRAVASPVATHAAAPKVAAVTLVARNKTTDTVDTRVVLDVPGDVHWVWGPLSAFRSVPGALQGQLAPYLTTYNTSFVHASVPLDSTNETTSGPFTVELALPGLEPATSYGVLVFAETSASHGVIGVPFATVEVKTHERAGDVLVSDPKPVAGSTSELAFAVRMTQPRDKLMVCYSVAVDAFDQAVFGATDAAPPSCYHHTPVPAVVVVANLTADTIYNVSMYAETAHGVESEHASLVPLATHGEPPEVTDVTLARRPGYADVLDAAIALDRPGFVHFVAVPSTEVDSWKTKPLNESVLSHAKRQEKLVLESATTMALEGLVPNTTYTLLLVTEAVYSRKNHSRVYGAVAMHNLSTFELAPTILHSVVDPLNATVDSIMIRANLSWPGRVHYMVADLDFEDPAVLQNPAMVQPHARRGYFDVTEPVLEPRNATVDGVNVTTWHPLDVFRANVTIGALEPQTLYHVYLATETFGSGGVFGSSALIPPHVVTTHAPPPTFDALSVRAADATADAVQLRFQLSRFGAVHYILVHRGTYVTMDLRDPATIPVNETTPVSALDVASLTPQAIKDASMDVLGAGVVDNGTVPVSREDWLKGAGGSKDFKGLCPGSAYDLCVVAETDASNGVFDAVVCRAVQTHADFSNLSRALDHLRVEAVPATTDAIQVEWTMACLDGACHRTPHFVLVDESLGGRPEFRHNHFGRDVRFDQLITGQHGVVAAGRLPKLETVANVTEWAGVNGSTVVLPPSATRVTYAMTIDGLRPHQTYFVFFAAATKASHGLFSSVNAHVNATQETFGVKTHGPPPRLMAYTARPTHGNVTGIDIVVDVQCSETKAATAILHAVVTPRNCSWGKPRCVLLNETTVVPMGNNHEAKGHVWFLENALLLAPNTTYDVYLATETDGSDGVVSPFRQLSVTTHAPPPRFTSLTARPKAASTTEVTLRWELTAPGVVHYMIQDEAHEINVTSVYNISGKKTPEGHEWHKYSHDQVKWRRSINVPDAATPVTEVVQHLTHNTNYTVYFVVETLADAGIYGSMTSIPHVATFAHAPLLLAHEATSTPATTDHLRVSYKLNEPGRTHVLITMASLWRPTLTTAMFGNVIGLDSTIVAQASLDGAANSVDIAVPRANQSYDVLLVTETTGSEGVFGAIAKMSAVKSSDVAPVIDHVDIRATDARNDALSIEIRLATVGIVHYSVVEKHVPVSLDGVRQLEVPNVTNLTAAVVVDGLKEGTVYDLYLQTETLGSFGVIGPLVKVDGTVATHGPPPLIVEDVDCTHTPASCEAIGREPCWAVAHTCGGCLDGFASTDDGPSNAPCTPAANTTATETKAPRKTKKSIGIKISGIKANHPDPKAETKVESKIETKIETQAEPQPAEYEVHPSGQIGLDVPLCPANAHASPTQPSQCECNDGFVLDNGACAPLCPPNSSSSGPGRCQCDPGFGLDAAQTACVLQVGSASLSAAIPVSA